MPQMKPQEHVLCALVAPESPESVRRISEAFPSIKVTWVTVPTTFDAKKVQATLPDGIFKDVTILCTYNAFPLTKEEAPLLRWVQLFTAGSNQLHDLWLYKDADVTVTTASGIHAPLIAEWVVMTALVHSRKYNSLHNLQKVKQWGIPEMDWNIVPTQVGRRLGVIGYGSIGRQVARVANAMGVEVLAYTATAKDTPEKRRDREFVIPSTGDPEGNIPKAWYSGLDKPSLHHFLEQDLDWIVVSVPLTRQTRHLLSLEEFGKLRQGGRKPFITNVARGAIVDQDALIAALKDGTLGGAALDVTDPEPLPADSELWNMENVIITPHVSGNGSSYRQRAFEVFEKNLQLFDEGKTMINVVNRERGY